MAECLTTLDKGFMLPDVVKRLFMIVRLATLFSHRLVEFMRTPFLIGPVATQYFN